MSAQDLTTSSVNRAQPFLIRSFSILTIDRPAFITNRTDTSVECPSASVGAHFRHFPFEEVDKTKSSRQLWPRQGSGEATPTLDPSPGSACSRFPPANPNVPAS